MGTGRCDYCATLMEAKDLKRCANCKVTFYCSKSCQKTHWKALHKATCPAQATIRENLKESPKEKEWSKKTTRWMNVWTNAIGACAPIALDLANHEWGHHDTHSLVMCMVPTGLDEECQLFRVTKAVIRETTTVAKKFPEIDYIMANPPSLKFPRLRCFLFFLEGPTEPSLGKIHTWCTPDLQDLYDADKGLSRSAAGLAIPELINQINVVREPQQAAKRLRLKVAFSAMFSGVPVTMVNRGDEEPAEEYIDRILHLTVGGDGGSGS